MTTKWRTFFSRRPTLIYDAYWSGGVFHKLGKGRSPFFSPAPSNKNSQSKEYKRIHTLTWINRNVIFSNCSFVCSNIWGKSTMFSFWRSNEATREGLRFFSTINGRWTVQPPGLHLVNRTTPHLGHLPPSSAIKSRWRHLNAITIWQGLLTRNGLILLQRGADSEGALHDWRTQVHHFKTTISFSSASSLCYLKMKCFYRSYRRSSKLETK